MNANFKMSMEDPMSKVSHYLSVIREVDYKKLINHLSIEEKWMVGSDERQSESLQNKKIKLISPQEKLKEREFRVLQYCCFIHPDTFGRYGRVMDWYDVGSMENEMEKGKSLYSKEGVKLMRGYVMNQESFINRVKKMSSLPDQPINAISIKRYEQFMFLVKEYDGILRFSPPFDVDIVWHAHMLDHSSYIKDTHAYFGRVLNHDDSEETQSKLKMYPELLPKLWEKHFGKGSFRLDDGSNNVDEKRSLNSSCITCG